MSILAKRFWVFPRQIRGAGQAEVRFGGYTAIDLALFYNRREIIALTIGTQLGSHEITALCLQAL